MSGDRQCNKKFRDIILPLGGFIDKIGNFARILNVSMNNRSSMAIDVPSIDVDAGLTVLPTDGERDLLSLISHLDLMKMQLHSCFLIPMKFSCDAQADANGDTLEGFLQGCLLVSGWTSTGITIDMSFDGQS
jgi:hypothetical protein